MRREAVRELVAQLREQATRLEDVLLLVLYFVIALVAGSLTARLQNLARRQSQVWCMTLPRRWSPCPAPS